MKPSSFAAFALLAPVAVVARSEVYLSAEQAAFQIFPGQKFTRQSFQLTDAQKEAIEKLSGQTVRSTEVQTLRAGKGAVVFVDQVIGKHELITIAVGIDAAGKVRGVEILEYKETYGYQVRNAEWRGQFVGKTVAADLKVGHDIQNISGATLSSAHVTSGVKRLLATFETLRPSLHGNTSAR